jgi:periodic tryptophan protein 2
VSASLPGVRAGDMGKRTVRPEIRCDAVRFSPIGDSFAATTTEGLCLFAAPLAPRFDPIDIDVQVTPAAVAEALAAENFFLALLLACRLNEQELIKRAWLAVPLDHVDGLVQRFPAVYLHALLAWLAACIDKAQLYEKTLAWVNAVLSSHSLRNDPALAPMLRHLLKGLRSWEQQVLNLASGNEAKLLFLTSLAVREE